MGNQSSYISFTDVAVKDQRRRIFDTAPYDPQAAAAKLFNANIHVTTVQPSFTIDLVLVYDVAADAENLVFVIDE